MKMENGGWAHYTSIKCGTVLVWVANSPRGLLTLYVVLLAVSGTLYSLFEDKNFADSLWWTHGSNDVRPHLRRLRHLEQTVVVGVVAFHHRSFYVHAAE